MNDGETTIAWHSTETYRFCRDEASDKRKAQSVDCWSWSHFLLEIESNSKLRQGNLRPENTESLRTRVKSKKHRGEKNKKPASVYRDTWIKTHEQYQDAEALKYLCPNRWKRSMKGRSLHYSLCTSQFDFESTTNDGHGSRMSRGTSANHLHSRLISEVWSPCARGTDCGKSYHNEEI